MSKPALKKEVNKACEDMNSKELKQDMVGKSKLAGLIDGDCLAKSYLGTKSLWEVRETFRARTQMTVGFKSNFQNMYKGGNLNCEGCEQVKDTQAHATICPAYSDLRGALISPWIATWSSSSGG